MPISRRGFLGYAAGVSTLAFTGGSRWPGVLPANAAKLSGCLLVDSGPGCTLQESVAGFESALSYAGVPYGCTSFRSLASARIIILPAAARLDAAKLARLRDCLERGSCVLLESGAGFLDSGEFDFHRRLIKSELGLCLHPPVGLWDSADSSRQSPYVDYRWPLAVKVRDFSRAVPVFCRKGEIIAWFGQLPVAARLRVGKGTLVFLGSPLGPHLLAGDREAGRWFGALCSSC
jgi:hypothetical protein